MGMKFFIVAEKVWKVSSALVDDRANLSGGASRRKRGTPIGDILHLIIFLNFVIQNPSPCRLLRPDDVRYSLFSSYVSSFRSFLKTDQQVRLLKDMLLYHNELIFLYHTKLYQII